ncbi:CD177 antigen-like [Suncus etruscus]|uniref:CD177 antigen-like n=1 Tax=Suncus etruscus TaxID=109475 RepID=UPI00210F5D0A|nr:CD177 antigen-like [Suncus etruscus]
MSSILLLALLGITFLWPLPGMQALKCQLGTFDSVRKRSEQLFNWTMGELNCPSDQPACQDTMLFIVNGPLMKVVVLKNCTSAPLQKNVTIHRADPGLSFLSYTHVCNEDLCNDLSSTYPLWGQVPPSVSGFMQCPFCLSEKDCLSSPMIACSVGTEHCYDGLLQLEGAPIHHKLRIQGCQAQPGCNLLNGTKEVSPLSLKEVCKTNGESYRAPLTSEVWAQALHQSDLSGEQRLYQRERPSSPGRSQVHARSPGVLIASYSHFCNKSNCNDANSSAVLLDQLPTPDPSAPIEAPGNKESQTVLAFRTMLKETKSCEVP